MLGVRYFLVQCERVVLEHDGALGGVAAEDPTAGIGDLQAQRFATHTHDQIAGVKHNLTVTLVRLERHPLRPNTALDRPRGILGQLVTRPNTHSQHIVPQRRHLHRQRSVPDADGVGRGGGRDGAKRQQSGDPEGAD